MQKAIFQSIFKNFTIFFAYFEFVVLEALKFLHIVDFTLLHISFVLFWDVIFLFGFPFSTGSNLDIDENPIGYTFIFLSSLARQKHSK